MHSRKMFGFNITPDVIAVYSAVYYNVGSKMGCEEHYIYKVLHIQKIAKHE